MDGCLPLKEPRGKLPELLIALAEAAGGQDDHGGVDLGLPAGIVGDDPGNGAVVVGEQVAGGVLGEDLHV